MNANTLVTRLDLDQVSGSAPSATIGIAARHQAHPQALHDRLVEHFLNATPLPGSAHERLTPTLFHRIYRAIAAEGYGR